VKGPAAPPSAPFTEVDVFPSAAAPSRHRAARAEGLVAGAEGLVSNGSAGAPVGVGVWDAACGLELESRVASGSVIAPCPSRLAAAPVAASDRLAAPMALSGEAAAGNPAAAAAASPVAACAATVFRPAHQLLTALSDRFRPALAPFSSRLLPPPPLAVPSAWPSCQRLSCLCGDPLASQCRAPRQPAAAIQLLLRPPQLHDRRQVPAAAPRDRRGAVGGKRGGTKRTLRHERLSHASALCA